MKVKFRCSIILLGLFMQTLAYGQQWPGFETGRFSGISSANQRPGGMAPIPYKVDATVFGLHLFAQPKSVFNKDFTDMIFSGGFKGFADFGNLSENKSMVISNLQGPSILGAPTERLSIAFSWNIRYMWLSDISEPKVTQLFDNDVSSINLNGDNESANMMYTSWNEFGFGAGGLLYDEGFHSFSVGGFVKMVFGTGHMNVNVTNLDFTIRNDNVEEMTFGVASEVSENMHELVDDGKIKLVDKIGYGFDLGAEYKFLNPRSCPGASNYRMKLGVAVTDIGKLNYQTATRYNSSSASATNIPLETFRASTLSRTLESIRDTFNINVQGLSDHKVTLPMSLKFYLEVNIKRRAIIYNEFQVIMAQLTNSEIPIVYRYNITPRFEDYRYGVYLPLTFSNYIPVSAGFALRLKPFIIGSGNLFTFWAYDDRDSALDFYVTIKVPIINDDERIDWKGMMRRK